ncbi:NRPS protein [Pestalotiopsis sp. IQ-011]
MSNGALSQLAVSVRKSASNDLTFSVTNNHAAPITLLRWESPLDPLALKLGKVRLFAPADSKEALDIPIIMVRRKMPPGTESLVTIEPGETAESSIELKEPLVPVDKLTGHVKVSYQGRWVSAWQKRADQISPKELEDLNAGEEALSGDYSMEPVTVGF